MNNLDYTEHVGQAAAKRVTLVDPNGVAVSSTSVIASTIGDGSKTILAAITPERLVASSTPCKWVEIVANEANTATIWVGGSTIDSGRGRPLVGLQSCFLNVSDLYGIWIKAGVNGEGVSFIYGS